jgi:hypothetical protein
MLDLHCSLVHNNAGSDPLFSLNSFTTKGKPRLHSYGKRWSLLVKLKALECDTACGKHFVTVCVFDGHAV